MLPAALSGEPVCHCGHKAEWPSGSGLSNQQGPAGWPGTQGGVSSHPGTPWVPGALHAPEEFCLAQSPGSCLPVWSGASHTAQLCRPSLHHPFRLSLTVWSTVGRTGDPMQGYCVSPHTCLPGPCLDRVAGGLEEQVERGGETRGAGLASEAPQTCTHRHLPPHVKSSDLPALPELSLQTSLSPSVSQFWEREFTSCSQNGTATWPRSPDNPLLCHAIHIVLR